MELTELSLAPTTASTAAGDTQFVVEKLSRSSSSSEEDCNHSSSSSISKKRKLFSDYHTSTVDLHVEDPLPLDWEQCLDLQSGRMYYLNRKTLRKSWKRPKDQKLDLELNISPLISDNQQHCDATSASINGRCNSLEESKKSLLSASSNTNMVALACLNCHLLVMLSTSSPSCPNCKYVHSLPITNPPQPHLPKISPAAKSLNTLSLLN